jgi:hypothetical protein
MRLEPVIAGLLFTLASTAATNPAAVTFTKDVALVLQKNCQECHRAGESAPFSLRTYEETRPWAKAMKEAVLLKKMPPWFADRHYGKFSNDRSLSQKEIDTLVAWADAGAPQGDPKDMPPPVNFVEGWRIRKPDVVFEIPADFEIPATGTVEYQYIVVQTGFTEDKWVEMAEARPGNRALVHHIVGYLREPGSKWLQGAKPGVPFVPPKRKDSDPGDASGLPSDFLVGFAPGLPPETHVPGQAKLVKAGSDIVFQMHYTANGKAGTDRSRIGLVFATEPPKERVFTVTATNGKFKIPPGDANYKVDSVFELGTDVTLVGMLPHMHLRGKDFEYRVVYPTGEIETLLRVPGYNFNWQQWYYPAQPIRLPKGAKIECTAHFDNSPNNPSNPDPSTQVVWGEQSWDEMMVGFLDVAFDARMPVKNLYVERNDDKRAAAE